MLLLKSVLKNIFSGVFHLWPMGSKIIPGPMWALRIFFILQLPGNCFFPRSFPIQICGVLSCMYIDWYLATDSRRPLFKFLKLFFCVDFFSLIAYLAYFSYICTLNCNLYFFYSAMLEIPLSGHEVCTLLQGRMPMPVKDSPYFLSLSLSLSLFVFRDYCPVLPIDIWRQLFHIFCSVFCLFMAERYIWMVLLPYGWKLMSLCHL